MNEADILLCRTDEDKWKCPVDGCGQLLSRKQTLKSHISIQHGIQAGQLPKRYKLYEVDDEIPVPKRTLYRRSATSRNLKESINLSSGDTTTWEVPHIELPLHDTVADLETDFNDEDNFVEQAMDLVFSEEENYESSEDETQREPDTCFLPSDDPPLYVVAPSETVYKCQVTRPDYLLAASALASKHNMSAKAIMDVIKFAQLGMPDNNLGDTSFDQLQRSCGFDGDYLQYHLYCNICKKLFDASAEQENCRTPNCIGDKKNSQSYFVTGKFDLQLKEILQRTHMWNSIEEFRNVSTASVSDVKSGHIYKRLQEPGGFLHKTSNITLSLFIDGIPLYKSSSVSLWPVYILINEIPPKDRFRRKNMILWGVWQGTGKPHMNMFLRRLVVDLLKLYTQGVCLNICSQDQEEIITVKAMLIIITMDLQARSYVTNMTQHNGEYGCLYCMEPGQIVPSGKGHCRAYLQRDQQPDLRDDKMARASATKAHQKGSRTEGFLGESVLWYLPYFSMVNHVVIDYMHGTLLGVTKKFLEYWFDSKHSQEPFYIGNNIASIDKLLIQIKPPYIIHRLPRVLSNTYNHWKASEFRNWLLFYSLPCLLGHLPNVYLSHFSCLVEAIYLLLTEGISSQDITRAQTLLQAFVCNTQILYGDSAMSLNVHNLNHMVHFVKQCGPIWAFSCFAFESFNGEIKKSIHGTGNVCKQVFWYLQAEKRVESKSSQVTSKKTREFLQVMLNPRSERFSAESEAYMCSVVKSSKPLNHLNDDVKRQLEKCIGTSQVCDFITVSKLARNGFQMYSKCCTKVKKQNSYTIKLEKCMHLEGNCDVIEVESYLMEKKSKKVFAIGQLMKLSGSILPRRVPHLQKVTPLGQAVHVVPAEKLSQPMMMVKGTETLFAALLPNNIERD